MELGVSLLAFLAVFLLFFGLDRAISAPNVIESRLDRYASRPASSGTIDAAAAEETGKRSLRNSLISPNMGKQLAIQLARADLRLNPSEYVLINIGLVILGVALGFIIGKGNILPAIGGGIVGFYALRFYVRYLQSKRLNAFNNQLSDTLLLLANALRSGYSLLQSMETVAKELPAPMSFEFERVTHEIGLGLTIEEALAHMLERLESDDLDLIITAINIQHEVGGNLAEILDTIAHTIRERVRIKGQIRSLTAQQSLSGTVISILPIALGGIVFFVNPKYILTLFENSCGIIMMIVGGLMIIAGYFAIRKITAIEV